ncbi:hypothetical protein LTR37_017212 [Vermiconidia calcicola]|uniref:Uncharacterized protein n=1 Tax=Vermiconidia calcicola TaxID=1690605 RepID=A0ACC3MKM9_9PEZI|nr:hypothetical protein LTR37_017212 [Vermiconidia calcicola]
MAQLSTGFDRSVWKPPIDLIVAQIKTLCAQVKDQLRLENIISQKTSFATTSEPVVLLRAASSAPPRRRRRSQQPLSTASVPQLKTNFSFDKHVFIDVVVGNHLRLGATRRASPKMKFSFDNSFSDAAISNYSELVKAPILDVVIRNNL